MLQSLNSYEHEVKWALTDKDKRYYIALWLWPKSITVKSNRYKPKLKYLKYNINSV